MKKKKKTVIILIILTVFIVLIPPLLIKGAQFEGSDSKGSEMVKEVTGGGHEPWFRPVLEKVLGGAVPAEVETLFFCIQTGIGVGIIAFCFGYLVARKKYNGKGDAK